MVEKKTGLDWVLDTLNTLLLVAIGLVCLYPFWYVVCASFSDANEFLRHDFTLLLKPLKFSLEAYRYCITDRILVGYRNTLFYVVAGTAISMFLTFLGAVANDGVEVTPHVVDKITDANGNVIEEIGANVRRQVISESTSNVIRQIMEYEVGAGTGGGKYAYVSGYRIGGKSGTSEQLNMDRRADGDYKKVASFAAVLPADDPEIIVYVMLDDPNNARTDYSSLLAAPVVGNIISEIAPYLGIAADGEDRSQTVVTVPNLVGTEWSSAQVQLNIKGLRHQLAESTTSQAAAAVTYQYPHAGAKVAYGTTVYLYTDTYEGSHTDVPDVTGKSADFARQMLSAAGLNCVVEGNANGTVQAQSADPGSSVQRGTVVTITCG